MYIFVNGMTFYACIVQTLHPFVEMGPVVFKYIQVYIHDIFDSDALQFFISN